MNQFLKVGQEVISREGGDVLKVEQFLGGGGQGEVYRVNLKGNALALKWYHPQAINKVYQKNLERLIGIGPPNDNFLWPLKLICDSDLEGFGYVMLLRDNAYRGIVDLMKRRIEPSFRTLTRAGFNLAHSFLQLHSKGMCYSDISFGNLFLHPESGDVLICDNDNCIFDGEKASIKGTPRFMAPEVVKGQNPNTQADLFSLAVLLFYMFFLHHPLEGKKEAAIKCFDLPAMKKLYGFEPIFIFDPEDDSNRPLPGLHDNALIYWPLYPRFFRDLFTRAFTVGIEDPINGRVRETEWRAAMFKLHDSIIYCNSCGVENFFDIDAISDDPDYRVTCWSCQKEVTLPLVLHMNHRFIALNYDTKIYPHHVDARAAYDFSYPVARISRHPHKPGVWGLKNSGVTTWVSTAENGRISNVEPGKNITLTSGTRINFGRSEGVVRYFSAQ